MKLGPAATPRILAGAPALDRRAFPRPGSVPRWFEPFHIRQPQVARGEVAAQVVAGADVVVAPAWLTHRRALEAVGESRRAQAWTNAAVRLAREAVEAGLERAGRGPETVLVAAPLPDVAARRDHATGRRLPASASAERDTHDQAGILADTGADLLLVERRSSFEATRRATEVAAETGRPTWTTIPIADAAGAPPLAERLAVLVTSGAEGVLLDVGDPTDPSGIIEPLARVIGATAAPMGLVAEAPPLPGTEEDLDACLQVGTCVLGIVAGADPDALRPLAAARDRLLTGVRERVDAERASLTAWILGAARRAPGGRALWLGPREVELPAGFDWTAVGASHVTLQGLPEAVFRLVICLADVEPGWLARWVEGGGVVALQTAGEEGIDPMGHMARAGLRVQHVENAPDGRLRLICRREDD